jgi:hypothetical protein
MQLPTGTGKSLMFGLMSRYINIIQGNKTVVAVPNEVLAAIQQQKYAPRASKIGNDLFNDSISGHYCTYEDVLTGNIPLNSVLFIDEIDSLFFADSPAVTEGKFLSAILLLNKYKVIGMTATFRGEQGLSVMKALLTDSAVIKTGAKEPERKLELDVFGNL